MFRKHGKIKIRLWMKESKDSGRTIQNGKLVYGDTEQTFSMGDSEWDKFGKENPKASWIAISDKSKIEELQ